jgi:hypothetical protein
MKRVKRVSMVEVLSIHIWIWNIETCESHFMKGSGRRGRIMEGMNQTGTICIHTGMSQLNPLYNYRILIKFFLKDLIFFFFAVLRFELRAYTLSHSTSPGGNETWSLPARITGVSHQCLAKTYCFKIGKVPSLDETVTLVGSRRDEPKAMWLLLLSTSMARVSCRRI